VDHTSPDSVTFNEPVTLDYPNENHVLELLDYDGILDPHRIATLRFKPHQVGTDFPNIIKLVSTKERRKNKMTILFLKTQSLQGFEYQKM